MICSMCIYIYIHIILNTLHINHKLVNFKTRSCTLAASWRKRRGAAGSRRRSLIIQTHIYIYIYIYHHQRMCSRQALYSRSFTCILTCTLTSTRMVYATEKELEKARQHHRASLPSDPEGSYYYYYYDYDDYDYVYY